MTPSGPLNYSANSAKYKEAAIYTKTNGAVEKLELNSPAGSEFETVCKFNLLSTFKFNAFGLHSHKESSNC